MAVAGLHKASTLNSYLSENHSPVSRMCSNKDTPTTRTSSIRKMWQDLESEGKCGIMMESEDTLLGDTNEIENECPQNQNQIAVQNRQEDDNRSCLHRSPSLDVPAKERVRKVFHDWGSRSFEGCLNNRSRAQSVRENECKRVRIVKECSQIGSQIEHGSSVADLGIISPKRPIRRIYGRQAVLDLLAKFVKEREIEVDSLLENQFVSNFAHRHRIQSLLKGRFLRNQRFVEDKKQTCVAASELGLLRQTHSVSDIRKGFLSRLNNCEHVSEVGQYDSYKYEEVGEFASPVTESHDPQFDIIKQTEEILDEREKLHSMEFTETRSQNHDDSLETNQNTYQIQSSQVEKKLHSLQLQTSSDSLNWQEISQQEEEWHESDTEDDDDDSEWHHLTRTESDEGIDVNSPVRSDSQESHEDWYDNNVQEETLETGMPMFTSNSTFYWSDDDDNNDRRFELTQLTNRRTVSNLLQSDFGPRLDQLLMQSLINRQNQAFDSENEGEIETVESPLTQVEREMISGLRVDMDTLKERMNEMQRMLEACMDMQLELKKSVHQEIYSALNQSPCCYLCCDDGFNRCGANMYICSKCGEKVNWSKLKESVR